MRGRYYVLPQDVAPETTPTGRPLAYSDTATCADSTGSESHSADSPKVGGLDLHVEELDAIDGTPVLDIKPWFQEFGPAQKSDKAHGRTRC